MKGCVLTFTQAGDNLYHKFLSSMNYDLFSKSHNTMVKKEDFQRIWDNYSKIVFIGATGIAVRYISAFIQQKDRDPAVLVIDDQGRFVISLLSGHLGGANRTAEDLAKRMKAIPVVTTASDSRGFESIDLFAQRMSYGIDDLSLLTPVASAMVEGKKVGFYSPFKNVLSYPNLEIITSEKDLDGLDYAIIVSESTKYPYKRHQAVLRPKTLHLGIGAKKGAKFQDLCHLVESTFLKHSLSILSIKDINSIDLKKEEMAILQLKQKLNVPFYTYSAQELCPFEKYCEGSEFVKSTVGVSSVSCTSALKRASNMVLEKESYKGFTLSITKEV